MGGFVFSLTLQSAVCSHFDAFFLADVLLALHRPQANEHDNTLFMLNVMHASLFAIPRCYDRSLALVLRESDPGPRSLAVTPFAAALQILGLFSSTCYFSLASLRAYSRSVKI